MVLKFPSQTEDSDIQTYKRLSRKWWNLSESPDDESEEMAELEVEMEVIWDRSDSRKTLESIFISVGNNRIVLD